MVQLTLLIFVSIALIFTTTTTQTVASTSIASLDSMQMVIEEQSRKPSVRDRLDFLVSKSSILENSFFTIEH
jgi:hypothetical protein